MNIVIRISTLVFLLMSSVTFAQDSATPVSYTHLRAHETTSHIAYAVF